MTKYQVTLEKTVTIIADNKKSAIHAAIWLDTQKQIESKVREVRQK